MKIRSKFLLYFIGWLIVLWVPTIFLFYFHAKDEIKTSTQESINRSSDIFQKTIAVFLEDRSKELLYLGTRIEKASKVQDAKYISEILYDIAAHLKKFVIFTVYDQQHKKIIDNNNGQNDTLLPRFFWNEVLRSKKTYIFPHYDPVLKNQFLIMAKKIKYNGKDGVLVGHISMDFVRKFLNEFNASVSSNGKIDVELIDQEGKIIFANHNEKWIAGENVFDTHLLELAKKSLGKLTKFSDDLSAIGLPINLLNENQWQLLFHFNPKEIYIEVNTYMAVMLVTFLIALIVAFVVAVYCARTLAGPIEKLTADLQHISLGNLEEFHPEKYHGSKEVRNMAVKISEMVFHLEVGLQQFHQKSRLQDLGEMAGGIAHEINNPLTIIEGRSRQINSLINKNAAPEEINKCITSIFNTTKRIVELIGNLRNLSRDAENDNFEIFPLSEIITTTLDVCRASLATKKIDLKTKYAVNELIINCRPAQVSQIILNLLNNAIDAVISDVKDTDKWIEIKTSSDDEWVVVEITNSGPKIKKELSSKLFRPFFTTKAPGKGTGIGLSLSKNFAQKHHGDLVLDISGEHTVFILRLPRVISHEAAA